MTSPAALEDLRSRVKGPVLTPDDDGFSEEVTGFNLASDYRPEIAVGATDSNDVAEAVRFAGAHAMQVRVTATGHAPANTISDGVLITTRRLAGVSVDPGSRIATIGAGTSWSAVSAAAAPFGLTAISGSSGHVGVVGLVLGGGLGPLARSHGFASDYVREFSVVTADGAHVVANADQNTDLFWALRGGKGGLGVVTGVRLELVDLPVAYAGALYFDTAFIEQALRGWIDWLPGAPEDVSTSVAVIRFPELDEVPDLFRGRHMLALRFAYPGGASDGERYAADLRAIAPALLDTIGVLPTANLALVHNDPDGPLPGWDRGMMLHSVDQRFADAVLAQVGPDSKAPFLVIEIRHLGGAVLPDVAGGSAVGGRSCAFTFTVIGVPDPQLFADVLPRAADRLVEEITPWLSPDTNINFAGSIRNNDHFDSAWPKSVRERLAAVKRRYDPTGLFTFGPVAD